MELVFSSGPPLSDLAFERDIIAAAVAEPVLFIYEWKTPFLVMGYSQDFAGIRIDHLRSSGITVLRRMTGGTAVLGRKALSASLVVPAGKEGRRDLSITGCYDLFTCSIRDGLKEGGIKAERCSVREKSGSPVCFSAEVRRRCSSKGEKYSAGPREGSRAWLLSTASCCWTRRPTPCARLRVTEEEVQRRIASVGVNDIGRLKRNIGLAFAQRLDEKITGIFKAEPTLASIKEQKSGKWSPLSGIR